MWQANHQPEELFLNKVIQLFYLAVFCLTALASLIRNQRYHIFQVVYASNSFLLNHSCLLKIFSTLSSFDGQ